MGVSSDPSCTPRILECFLLCDDAFPNTSPTMTPLETSLEHRTLWKEVFIFLRSKGNFWVRVSTDKGGCNLGPHWPDSQFTPIPPWGVHQGLSCGDGTHRLRGRSTAQPPPGGAGASEHSLEKSGEPDPQPNSAAGPLGYRFFVRVKLSCLSLRTGAGQG